MAEKKSSGGGSKNQRRKGRRRYFRRRKADDEQSSEEKKDQPQGKSKKGADRNERARKERRRRNKRRRPRSSRKKEYSGPSIIDEIKKSYTPPDSVFIYTHVLRKEQRDVAYEYRSEHFSHVGRSMADFRINLTSLYDDILDPEKAPQDVQDELHRIAEENPVPEPVDIFRDFESNYDGAYDDELPIEQDDESEDNNQTDAQ